MRKILSALKSLVMPRYDLTYLVYFDDTLFGMDAFGQERGTPMWTWRAPNSAMTPANALARWRVRRALVEPRSFGMPDPFPFSAEDFAKADQRVRERNRQFQEIADLSPLTDYDYRRSPLLGKRAFWYPVMQERMQHNG